MLTDSSCKGIKAMNLIDSLEKIKDFRRKEGLRYPLAPVLLIIIMAIMSGRFGYREIAQFAAANKSELLKFFKLKRDRLPSHVTFRQVIKSINFDEAASIFKEWALQYIKVKDGEWFSIDGKAIASTVTDYDKRYQNFVSLVSLFSHKRGQVLSAEKFENNKSGEIAAVMDLINTLDLQGVVLTLDALHCQKKL